MTPAQLSLLLEGTGVALAETNQAADDRRMRELALYPTHVVAAERVFADDTPLPVLEPSRGRTETGRFWAYTRDDRPFGGKAPPTVAFICASDRRDARPAKHLESFRGILQLDGDVGFEALAFDGTIALAECWSPVRRKFYELHEAAFSRRPRRH